MKHTPAPWKLVIDWDDKYPFAVIDPTTEGHTVGPVHICNVNPNLAEESEANARLIAAAPELLAALEAIDALIPDYIDENANTTEGKIRAAARAAIAKAKGE